VLVIKRPLGCLFEVVETLVLTVVIFLVIQNFVAQPYRVEQESMQRTLEQGQYLLVDKLTPRFDAYSRGDIVVFTPPNEGADNSTPFIKRVIGLPGDRVEIKDGAVFVNAHELDEPYVYDNQPTEATGERSTFTVPAGTLFVMGDHRANSTDSRVFGPIPLSNVIGRAWLRYWPITTLRVLDVPRYPGLASATQLAIAGGQVP
jgi:signal peptidase I